MKLLEFYKGCQDTFSSSKKERDMFETCSQKGPHLVWRGEFHAFTSCGGKISPLELHGDPGDPLVFPQGSHISLGAVRGTWGFLLMLLQDE